MNILALDLGTTTGYAQVTSGNVTSGVIGFRAGRFEGGGMRFLRFRNWLSSRLSESSIHAIYFEEVRRHLGVDAAHAYGGYLATLTAWAEYNNIPYTGVGVGTIKKHATGMGNAPKEAMIAAAIKRGFCPADDNEADALALLFYAIEDQGK